MELLQLRYFYEAARCENFSLVARAYSVPPSDVSQSIKRLEDELDTELFVRHKNRVSLSDNGKKFYEHVRSVLLELDNAVFALKDRENSGKIKICINANRRIVVQTIEKYRKKYPDVEIIATHFADAQPDKFDIIIDEDGKKLDDCQKTLLVTEQILLAVKRDSVYAKKEKLSLRDLQNEPFVTLNESSSIYKITVELCRRHGFVPHIAVQSDDPFYVHKCVELGLGVTLSPAFSWKGQFSQDVVFKKIGDYTRDTYIYTPSKRHIPLCAKAFIQMLKEECKGE